MNETCPKCDGLLVEKIFDDKNLVKVDRCKKCRGVWFEEGELTSLKGLVSKTAEFWQRMAKGFQTELKCPKCRNLKLVEMPYLDNPLLTQYDVHVDFCIKCHGLWLDNNELPKVVKLSEAEAFKDEFWTMLKILEKES